MDASIKICKEPGCRYSETQVCMENLGDSCPSIKMVLGNSEIQDVPDPVRQTLPSLDLTELSGNVEFLENTLGELTNNFLCNLVLLIGEPECGKSTLYAALFDRFHKGGCGEYFFAGTRTPVGFERRCHKARMISENVISKTERTPNFEFSYLHLSVRHSSLSKPIEHLLFADVNGEKFQAARDADDDMKKMNIFNRADHICLVADGEALINNSKKHIVKDELVRIVKRAVQNNMLSTDKGFHLLITKWDKIVGAGKEQVVEDFLITPFSTMFAEVMKKTLKLASRSQNENVESGYGIDEFLNTMLSRKAVVNNDFDFELPARARSFQKFKYKA